jgi:hypothetical protein
MILVIPVSAYILSENVWKKPKGCKGYVFNRRLIMVSRYLYEKTNHVSHAFEYPGLHPSNKRMFQQ